MNDNPYISARPLGQIAAHGQYNRTNYRTRQRLEERHGRTCTTCSKPLSIYNPAPTCWACDGGIWREPKHGEWGGDT